MEDTSSVNVTLGATLTSSFPSSFQKATKALNDLRSGFQSTVKASRGLASAIDDLPSSLNKVEQSATRMKRAGDSLSSTITTLSRNVEAANENFATTAKRLTTMESAFASTTQGMSRFTSGLSETSRLVARYAETVDGASAITGKAVSTYNDAATSLARLTSGYRDAVAAINEFTGAAQRVQRLAPAGSQVPSIRRGYASSARPMISDATTIDGEYTDVTGQASIGYRGSYRRSGGSVPPISGGGRPREPFWGSGAGGGGRGGVGGGHGGGGHGFLGGSLLHAFVGGSAIYGGGRFVHKAYESGAESQAIDYEMINAGLSPADIARVNRNAAFQSRNTPQFSENQIRKSSLELRTAFGGDINKAVDNTDFLLKAAADMRAVRPDQDTLGQLFNLVKSDEMRGLTNPADFRQAIEGQEKAFVYSGGRITGQDFLTAFKGARSGGLALDNEFVTKIMPQLMYEMGSSNTGTALNSLMTSFVGNRMPKADARRLAQMGVYDTNKIVWSKGSIQEIDKGAVARSDILQANPEKWANEVLVPILQRNGLIGQRDGNGDFSRQDMEAIGSVLTQVISNQRSRDMVTKLITQGARFRRGAESGAMAKSVEEQYANNQNRADVAFENMAGAFTNMLTAMTKADMPMVSRVFNGLATAMNAVASIPPGVLGFFTEIGVGIVGLKLAMVGGRLAFSTIIEPLQLVTAKTALLRAEMAATGGAMGTAAVPASRMATSFASLIGPLTAMVGLAEYAKSLGVFSLPQDAIAREGMLKGGARTALDFLDPNFGNLVLGKAPATAKKQSEENSPVHFDDLSGGRGPQAIPESRRVVGKHLPVTKGWEEPRPHQGFATGGQFIVRGAGGLDNNVVRFRASDGERVTIETPDQQRQGGLSVQETGSELRRVFADAGKLAARDFVTQFKSEIRHQNLMAFGGVNPGSESYGSAVASGVVSGGPSLRYGRSGSSAGLPSMRYGRGGSGSYRRAPTRSGHGGYHRGHSAGQDAYSGGTMPRGDGADPTSLKGVLFRGESGGNPGIFNHRVGGRYAVGHFDADTMTVGELMREQASGQVFAAGKYQVIPNTMKGAVSALGLKPTDKFDSATQDRIFTDYLAGSKRPQISNFITGKSDDLKAAHLAMAREWASVAYGGHGIYDKDGVNHASISDAAAEKALQKARDTYKALTAKGMDPNTARRSALLGIKDGGSAPAGTAAVGNYYDKHAAQKSRSAPAQVNRSIHAPINIHPQAHQDPKQIAREVVAHLDQHDKSADLRSSMIDWHTG